MARNFWSWLALPLVLLFGVVISIHTRWPADGFFLNLATEIIGILITIVYVDRIFKRHEMQRWLSTDTRIANRLRILLNAIVTGIRAGLGFGPEVLDEGCLVSKSPIAIHNEIIRIAEHVISPAVYHRVRALDSRGWKSLATQVANSHNGTLTFLNAFQARLSPEQTSDLLDLQEALSNSLIFYTVFPDLAGVTERDLPKTRTPPEVLQQSGYEATAKELQRVLALTKRISQSITRDA